MFFIFRFIRAMYSLLLIILGWIIKVTYRIQYGKSTYKVGSCFKTYGSFFMRIKGELIIGNNVVINNYTRFNYVGIFKKSSLYIAKDAKLIIGDYSGFSGVSIVCNKYINIGRYCNFGGNVCIWDTDFHPLDHLERRVNNYELINSKPILIGDDVFVGANSIILKGVKIGDRVIIGAGSVVTHSIPNDEIWAGNPAVFIRKIND